MWIYLLLHSSHAWLTAPVLCISYSHAVFLHLYSCEPLKIFQTELCWSSVQSKIQIIRGLTGLFPRIQPRPFLNSLSGSPTFIPSAFKRGGRAEMNVPGKKKIRTRTRQERCGKDRPLDQRRVGRSLLGVSATCCAQLAEYTATRNSLGRKRLVYK